MFPLYVKTNQADGENYYWLRGVECGGGTVDKKGRLYNYHHLDH